MSNTDRITTPMPHFLSLNDPTDKLEAAAAALSRWDELSQQLRFETIDALETLGASFDEAYNVLEPEPAETYWDVEVLVGDIRAELKRRKGEQLPGLEDVGQ